MRNQFCIPRCSSYINFNNRPTIRLDSLVVLVAGLPVRMIPVGRHCLLVWALVSGVCMVTGGLLVLFLFSSLVDAIISSKVQLLPGSEVAEAFLNPPVTPFLRVYYFNVTNPEVITSRIDNKNGH